MNENRKIEMYNLRESLKTKGPGAITPIAVKDFEDYVEYCRDYPEQAAEPQGNPKEGDVIMTKEAEAALKRFNEKIMRESTEESRQASQQIYAGQLDPNSNSGLGSALLAASDQYRLTALQQIRMHCLDAAIALLTCEDIDKDRDLAAEETAVKAAAKFESYILNGTQDDGEKDE